MIWVRLVDTDAQQKLGCGHQRDNCALLSHIVAYVLVSCSASCLEASLSQASPTRLSAQPAAAHVM